MSYSPQSLCVLCLSTGNGQVVSRAQWFRGCQCTSPICDECWETFTASSYSNRCPTCRKACIMNQNVNIDVVVIVNNEEREQEEEEVRRHANRPRCYYFINAFLIVYYFGMLVAFLLGSTLYDTDNSWAFWALVACMPRYIFGLVTTLCGLYYNEPRVFNRRFCCCYRDVLDITSIFTWLLMAALSLWTMTTTIGSAILNLLQLIIIAEVLLILMMSLAATILCLAHCYYGHGVSLFD